MLYVVLAFVAVLVTPSTDTVFVLANWSPTWLNRPYMATTTGALWSKHWHSNLRPILVSLAHKPAHDLASVWHPRLSRPAALFASFFLSGMIHEIGFYPSARFVEVRDQRKTVGFGAGGFGATRFFLWSAVAIIAETWFKENKVERRLARLLHGSKDVDLLIEKSWMRQTVVRLWTGTILLITFRSFADVGCPTSYRSSVTTWLTFFDTRCYSRCGCITEHVRVRGRFVGSHDFFASSSRFTTVLFTSRCLPSRPRLTQPPLEDGLLSLYSYRDMCHAVVKIESTIDRSPRPRPHRHQPLAPLLAPPRPC